MTKAKEGEFVPGYALHEFPFFIWYTYPQLLLKNAAPRPGSFFDRHGGSILGRRQHAVLDGVEWVRCRAKGCRSSSSLRRLSMPCYLHGRALTRTGGVPARCPASDRSIQT